MHDTRGIGWRRKRHERGYMQKTKRLIVGVLWIDDLFAITDGYVFWESTPRTSAKQTWRQRY